VHHHILEPPKADRASQCPISRRALLEGSASVVAAVGGWAGTTLLPAAANAADPAAGGSSPRQLATFRMRQAAAQAYLDEPQPNPMGTGDALSDSIKGTASGLSARST
jgi:hypothetical protein